MAGFKTHITVSTTLGVAGAAVSVFGYGVPVPTALLAGGLCSVSGMLPDLDSDSGTPLRESIAFAAAILPMLLIPRMKHLGWSPETMVLVGAGAYLFVRFGLAKVLKRYTVHRGMYHSIPAALIAAEVAFLVCGHEDLWSHYYHAGAVLLGFMSHLVLDEIWSMEFHLGYIHFKKSFGTAIKFWSQSRWGNVSAYAKLLLFTFMALRDPVWSNPESQSGYNIPLIAQRTWARWTGGAAPTDGQWQPNQPGQDQQDPRGFASAESQRRSAPAEYRTDATQPTWGSDPRDAFSADTQQARRPDPRDAWNAGSAYPQQQPQLQPQQQPQPQLQLQQQPQQQQRRWVRANSRFEY